MPRGWELFHGRGLDNLYGHWAASSWFGGDVPVNPTDGVIPWNNAGTFDDSNLLRRNTSTTDLRYLVTGTVAQVFRIYKTSDNGIASPTNFERIVIDSDTTNNVFRIHTEAGGTGTQRPINIGQASGAFAVPVGINAAPGSLTAGRALQIGRTQATPTDDVDLYFEGVASQTGDFVQANSPDRGGTVFRVDPNGTIILGRASSVDGAITLQNDSNAFTTSIIPGAAPASSVVLRLPSDDPAAGDVLLVTSFAGGTGVLEWATGGSITAPGSTTQLIRNAAGVFGAITGVTSDGTNITAGDGNLRATSPWITTGIDDSAGNRMIGFTATGSAVNYVDITNGAASGVVVLGAAGTDTNIGLKLASKGSDEVEINCGPRVWGIASSGNFTFRGGREWRLAWTTDTGPSTGTVDVEITRGNLYSNTVYLTNGSTGIGNLMRGRNVVVKTTDYTVLVTDSDTVFTNEGATAGVNFTLPTAVSDYTYTFIVQDADGITVTANTGDTIRLAGSVSAAAGNISSTTIGSAVILVCINTTEWVAISIVGTWTVT